MNSFFSYARQLQTLREGIKTDEQKEIFDMEVIIKVSFIQEYWKKFINISNQCYTKFWLLQNSFILFSDSVMDTTHATEGKLFQYRQNIDTD